MSRLSTLAVSTFVPALKVLSTTLPDITALSFVRTNAGPLPGFTCWNSTTDHSWPSRLSTMPFLRSFVDAKEVSLVFGSGVAISRPDYRRLGSSPFAVSDGEEADTRGGGG